MSWQKCDDVESYSLAIPRLLVFILGALHLWVGMGVFGLRLPDDLIALVVILAVHSWRQLQHRSLAMNAQRLSMDQAERVYIHEAIRKYDPDGRRAHHQAPPISIELSDHAVTAARSRERPFNAAASIANDGKHSGVATRDKPLWRHAKVYTVCRSVGAPGCIYVKLEDELGKHLEILVFYRYDQRQIYRRLWRFLVLQ